MDFPRLLDSSKIIVILKTHTNWSCGRSFDTKAIILCETFSAFHPHNMLFLFPVVIFDVSVLAASLRAHHLQSSWRLPEKSYAWDMRFFDSHHSKNGGMASSPDKLWTHSFGKIFVPMCWLFQHPSFQNILVRLDHFPKFSGV